MAEVIDAAPRWLHLAPTLRRGSKSRRSSVESGHEPLERPRPDSHAKRGIEKVLIRLEQRGFIRRVPGKARAIGLLIQPDEIPPLDRPFTF